MLTGKCYRCAEKERRQVQKKSSVDTSLSYSTHKRQSENAVLAGIPQAQEKHKKGGGAKVKQAQSSPPTV